jgi:predicted transcriptional regulator
MQIIQPYLYFCFYVEHFKLRKIVDFVVIYWFFLVKHLKFNVLSQSDTLVRVLKYFISSPIKLTATI